MRPIALSPRLLALARQVPQGVRFADVGTDHARLPVWLLEHGVIDHAIATDLREVPLEQARETARRHGVRLAVLKERSPSCGCGAVYDGTFTGTVVPGDGVAAARLKEQGVAIYGESRIKELL